jgi:hypothetical protein
VCIAVLEQLIDVFKSNTEETIKSAPVGSEPWLQAKVLEFQYDAVVPQVITLVDFSPQYVPVDPSKRIISRVSVNTGTNNNVLVKVATGNPPVALSGPQLSALQAYLSDNGDGTTAGKGVGIGFSGIRYVASSIASDKLFLSGTIYYNAQYSGTIQAAVIAAINAYLASLSPVNLNGVVTLLGLTDAIQGATGVNNLLLSDVAIRANATAFSSKTYLRQAQTDIIISYPLFAGYAEEETTGGETFTDRLTFTAS